MQQTHRSTSDVISRLSKVEGHVKGIKRMVEEGKSCDDVLLQISAVQAALKQVSRIVLEDHLEHCVMDGLENGTGKDVLQSLKAALSRIL